MLEDLKKGIKRRPKFTCIFNAKIRMPLSIPQDTKQSIVICPSRAHTRIFWYQNPKDVDYRRLYEIYGN